MNYPNMADFGFCTIEALAEVAGLKNGQTLRVMVNSGQLPPLPEPVYKKLGDRSWYALSDVERYGRQVEQFRVEAPARAAAKAKAKADHERFHEEMRQRQWAEAKRISDAMAEGEEANRAERAKFEQDSHDEMMRASEGITRMAKGG